MLVDFWAPGAVPAGSSLRISRSSTASATICAIVKLNVDDNPQTAAQYNVMSIPTLLLFKNGEAGAPDRRRAAEEPARAGARAFALRPSGCRSSRSSGAGPLGQSQGRGDRRTSRRRASCRHPAARTRTGAAKFVDRGRGLRLRRTQWLEFMAARMPRSRALVLGRHTYEDFAGYWPKQTDNPYTEVLDKSTKYVASTTLSEPLPWRNRCCSTATFAPRWRPSGRSREATASCWAAASRRDP